MYDVIYYYITRDVRLCGRIIITTGFASSLLILPIVMLIVGLCSLAFVELSSVIMCATRCMMDIMALDIHLSYHIIYVKCRSLSKIMKGDMHKIFSFAHLHHVIND